MSEKITFKSWWDEGMKQPKRFFTGLSLVFLAIFAGFYIPAHLSTPVTKSLDQKLFFLQDYWLKIEANDFVMFKHHSPWEEQLSKDLAEQKHIPIQAKIEKHDPLVPDVFIKQVTCAPGQRLSIKDSLEFFCDDRFLGKALTQDSKGSKLEVFSFSGTIPEGKYFVSGKHERSYDSKYYGFIDDSEILKKALPIF
jgi:signal peptidase I